MNRIIALLDMDCFYVQVHQREEPSTWGTSCAVVQYTGGGVIAVNYEAREYGIKRGFRVDQCKAACSTVRLFRVPELRGKADLTMYRNASLEVFEILSSYDARIKVERASIDEAFLDLTEFVKNVSPDHKCMKQDISDVHVAGLSPPTVEYFTSISDIDFEGENMTEETGLLIAAKVMSQLKMEIKEKTQFSCSSGISRNKIMSKLACGFKKPNGLSIFPKAGLEEVWKKTSIKKVRNLGGKLGSLLMSHFQIEMMSDLSALSSDQLESAVGSKSAEWIVGILQGNDDEPVSSRLISKSVGCGKNFTGLTSFKDVKHWITQLSSELVERLKEDQRINQRRARSMIFGIKFKKNFESLTKTLPVHDYQVELITDEVMKTMASRFSENTIQPIASLYLTASKFVDEDVILKSAVHKTARLDRYFTSVEKNSFVFDQTSRVVETSTDTGIVAICDSSEEDIENDRKSFFVSEEESDEGGGKEDVMIVDDLIEPVSSSGDEIDDENMYVENPNITTSFFYRKTLELVESDPSLLPIEILSDDEE